MRFFSVCTIFWWRFKADLYGWLWDGRLHPSESPIKQPRAIVMIESMVIVPPIVYVYCVGGKIREHNQNSDSLM